MSEGRRLTVLDERRAALEMCGYCPKLCRETCPVSEATGREALIPWGKMSMTWYAARGDLEADRDVAALPWACTGCFACRERCEHQNPVAETLGAARAVYRARGLAPAGSEAALRAFAKRRERLSRRARALDPGTNGRAALVIGCGYLALATDEAADVVHAAEGLLGDVHVLDGCCGLVRREAGDAEGADADRAALLAQAKGRPLVVADAGCALELRAHGATTLVEVAAERLSRLEHAPELAGPVRYHDPCRLSRGLGVTEAPRAVLTRALGHPPSEFEHRGSGTRCSGAGSLLPFTMPDAARAIARARLDEHAELGGGTLVTACAASLRWFRLAGARAHDLSSVIARSLGRG
ncbi:MAG TPA: (Fe-S)-binding protein [Polyangiaceae bacterium]|jgi:Fe-S oxidoreductase|nr:(Fe-S)-binding protein [Polyangiaceae bacterium]